MGGLPPGWVKKESRSNKGQFYYINLETGETQWTVPEKLPPLVPKKRKTDSPPEKKKDPASPPQKPMEPLVKKPKVELPVDLYGDLPEANTLACSAKVEAKIAPAPPKPTTTVTALHILKKHTGSRRPSSWRQKVITREKEEATYQLKQFYDKIVAAGKGDGGAQALRKKFETIARTESDCTSAHEGGSLGKFKKGQMQKAFEDAAFALHPGELSNIISTDSGEHIILRIE